MLRVPMVSVSGKLKQAGQSDISSIAGVCSRIMKFNGLACPSRKKTERRGP